jgi:hypothetical protein
MPFARRRPLLRAAVIGGGAYAVGRSAANRSAQQAQQDSGQDARISDLEQSQQAPQVPQQAPPPAAPPAAPPAGDSMLDQLSKLTALHEQGALTDAEFSAAKAKLLGTG